MICLVSRPYQLKQRADRQAETRQRIIEATIELHQTIGPAATTISEIAKRAGVGRVTVYRHFPEELSLDRACSGLYFAAEPGAGPGRLEGGRRSGRAAAPGAEGDVRVPRAHRADDRARARGRPRSPRDGAVPRALGPSCSRAARALAGEREAPHAAARGARARRELRQLAHARARAAPLAPAGDRPRRAPHARAAPAARPGGA